MRAKRASRVDETQAAIVKALRWNGMSVKDCSAVGQGFPDLCVGYRRGNYLIEVKSDKSVSHRVSEPLTSAQQEFHASWAGAIGIVETPEQAVEWVVSQARRDGRI